MIAPAELSGSIDPRIRRTRRLLADALGHLLSEKEFEKISVQDIAEKAAVNRATFYDHYPDKFGLLKCLVGQRFQDVIARRGLRFDACAGATEKVALIVCDFLSELRARGGRRQSHLEMHVQMATIGTIRSMILQGLDDHASPSVGASMRERTATAAAWAITGLANEWAEADSRCTIEDASAAIEALVYPLLAPTLKETHTL